MTNEEEVKKNSQNMSLISSQANETPETIKSSIGVEDFNPIATSVKSIDASGKKSTDIGGSERGKDCLIKENAKNCCEKKTKGIKLDATAAARLEQEVQMNTMKHQLATKTLSAREFWFFTVPQSILTMLSSILAFVATSDLLNNKTKVIINIIVGSTAGAVVFLQTMSGVCCYGTRAAMHDSTAVDLRDLRDHLVLLKQKLILMEKRRNRKIISIETSPSLSSDCIGVNDTKTEDNEDNEDVDNNEDNASNFEDIQTRFKQSLSGCKSTVPLEISEAFHGVQSDLYLTGTWKALECMYGKYNHYRIIEYVHLKAFDILSGEITNSRFFPVFLPNADEVVEVTMNRLKKKAKESENYWFSESV